ncbi:unnamed protein product, partial [Vitis vinifera]
MEEHLNSFLSRLSAMITPRSTSFNFLTVVKKSELSLKSRAFCHIQLLMGSHHEIFPTFFATDFRECLSEAR